LLTLTASVFKTDVSNYDTNLKGSLVVSTRHVSPLEATTTYRALRNTLTDPESGSFVTQTFDSAEDLLPKDLSSD